MPSPDSQSWRRHARRYDRVTLALNRRLPALARRIADDLRGRAVVLEVAAGTGLVTEALAPAVGHLVATDRSEAMLAVLRGRLGAAANVEIRTADALALPLGDGSVDAVVAANLLHLLPDPVAALGQLARVLRPGGLLAVPTFAHGEHRRARAISRLLAALTGFPIVTRFGGDALARPVEAGPFAIVRDEVVPGLLPIRDVLARRR